MYEMKPAQPSMQYLFSRKQSTNLALLHVHPCSAYVACESTGSPSVHTTHGWLSTTCQFSPSKRYHKPYLGQLASLFQGHLVSTILVQSVECQSLGTQRLVDSHGLGDIHGSTTNAFALQSFGNVKGLDPVNASFRKV